VDSPTAPGDGPAPPQRQAELLLIADVLVMLPAALVNNIAVIAVSVIIAGLCAAPLITARSLAIRDELPDDMLAAGFSSLYAVNGSGYGIAGLIVGALLPMGTRTAYTVPLLTTLVITIIVSLYGTRRAHWPAEAPHPRRSEHPAAVDRRDDRVIG
jgi:MFS family permease